MDHGIKPLRYLESKSNRNNKMENYKVICPKMIPVWVDDDGGRSERKRTLLDSKS